MQITSFLPKLSTSHTQNEAQKNQSQSIGFKSAKHQISKKECMSYLKENLSPSLMQRVEKELAKKSAARSVNELAFGRNESKLVYSIKEDSPALEKILAKGDDYAGSILGGKGKNLAVMKTTLGLPVPPAATATTEACLEYLGINELPKSLMRQVEKELKQGTPEEQARKEVVMKEVMKEVSTSMKDIEKETGFKFGDSEKPLLVSVRSGAKISMPGMMDTVLNLGINDKTRVGVQKQLGEKVGLDSERRFLEMFGDVVLGIEKEKFDYELSRIKKEEDVNLDNELSPDALKRVIKAYENVYKKEGITIPTTLSVQEQLQMGVEAVFSSWNVKRAIDYREANGLPHDMGTAVNIQAMVFGNSPGGATAVVTSRDISTGMNVVSGDYLNEAQGEDVVNGSRPTKNISQMKAEMPRIYAQLERTLEKLEHHFGDAQDVELTIQKNPETGRPELWMLQTRNAKRTGTAAVNIAVDMKNEGIISKEKALIQFDPNLLDQVLLPVFDIDAKKSAEKSGKLINDPKMAVAAAPGAASGVVALTPEKAEELAEQGKNVILIREETTPDDFSGMLASKGILTRSGGTSSHAALVARQFGKPCVSSASDIVIDRANGQITDAYGNVYREGMDTISIDGSASQVFAGEIATMQPDLDNFKEYQTLMKWADEARTMKIKTNADTPADAAKAIDLGAEGIGLCRTEHMFGAERTPVVRDMIFASQDLDKAKNEKEKEIAAGKLDKSLNQLGEWQKGDFKGIFQAMQNRPVTIRLVDPPLHEFLPTQDSIKEEIAGMDKRNRSLLREKQQLLEAVEDLHESNPMLGTRGVRLGLKIPGLIKMQARAIAEAACEVQKESGVKVKPQIMVPLVSNVNELKEARKVIDKEVQAVMKEKSVKKLDYQIGTMIELPRAAVTADEIAEEADFFSWGTNDLTQTTLGISRDDAEKGFLNDYIRKGIFPANPFATIDQEGVGGLVKMGVEKGRQTKADLDIGVCGEHGGDPKSVAFFHKTGFNSVSCSPNRVPIARLAAAQAAVREKLNK